MKKLQLRNIILTAIIIASLNACSKDDTEPSTPIRPVTPTSSKYVTDLFDYTPAPGQFINTSLGNNAGAETILQSKDGLVSLGAWGGYIVLGFDHTVLNTDTDDVMIYANASTNFAEPAVVYVMQDDNRNGQPDDTWYEIAGSELNNSSYIRDYSVTYTRPDPVTGDVPWTDNKGNSGVVKTNTFHTQAYYPEWLSGEYTLTGSLLPSSNIDDSNPSNITSQPFAYGYADNKPGGDRIDIEDAVNNNGNKVHLKGIDYIKIQTGILYDMGWLGEQSTEVAGVADISMGL